MSARGAWLVVGLALWVFPAQAATPGVLAERLEHIRVGLEESAASVENTPQARERLQLARSALVAAEGDPAWLDAFSERARSLEWHDPEALIRDAAAALGLLERELRALADTPSGDRRFVEQSDQQALLRLLADPEFEDVTKGASEPGALERFWVWLKSLFFEGFASHSSTRAVALVGWLMRGMLVVFGIVTAVWLFRRLRTGLKRMGPSATGGPDPTGNAPRPTHVSSRTELLRAGRHREALRAVHVETLAELARRGATSGAVTRTHWEELAALASRGTPAGRLDGFAALNREFDQVWYRGEQVDAHRFEHFEAATQRWLADFRDPP